MRIPAVAVITGTYGRPSTSLTTSAITAYRNPMIAWPRRKPPNNRPMARSRSRASSA